MRFQAKRMPARGLSVRLVASASVAEAVNGTVAKADRPTVAESARTLLDICYAGNNNS